MNEKWYQLDTKSVISLLKTNQDSGLSTQETILRQKKFGLNKLIEGHREPLYRLFFKQFLDPLIYLLVGAALLVFFIGEYVDGSIITAMLVINAIVSAIQEGRAQNILSGLQKLVETKAFVIRDGKKELIDDGLLVPGDIIILESGSRVPADARIITSYSLSIDESMLTGESKAVYKHANAIDKPATIFQMNNSVFMGTVVVDGAGIAVVTNTGQSTEIGKLQKDIEKIDTEVPLEKELKKISHFILLAAVLFCGFFFVYGWWVKYSLYDLFVTLTVMFVAIVPEELTVVLTMILVGGARRLAKSKVLVKRLRAVETLGHAQVLVIDKTGTLTRNEMVVEKIYSDQRLYSVSGKGYSSYGKVTIEGKKANIDKDTSLYEIARAASLLSTAAIEKSSQETYIVKGSATMAAGEVFAQKLGFYENKLKKEYKEVYEIPFKPKLRFSAALYKHKNTYVAYLTGSPELILKNSKNVTSEDRNMFDLFLDEGYRVVAYARCIEETELENPKEYLESILEKQIEFLGLMAIQDAMREEVPSMIAQAYRSGLQVVMATGDHEKTARFIGERTGIIEKGDHNVLNGQNFSEISDEQMMKKIDEIKIYARFTPQNKLRLIKLFHKKEKIVAMTGDGVNDAPALVAADLGIAMGERGSSIAHQAADMVLLNDSFATIIQAIKEGRHIFYRLRQGILYFIITDFSLIFLMLVTLFLKKPLPLVAIQIMWIHVFSDGFFSIALAQEPVEPGLLEKKWIKNKGKKLLDASNIIRALFLAIPMTVITLWYFLSYYSENLILARTIVFTSLTIFKWYNAWNCRSENQSIFRLGLFSNTALMISLVCAASLLLFAVYSPMLQPAFSTTALSLSMWVKLIIINSCVIILEELRKYFYRKNTFTS